METLDIDSLRVVLDDKTRMVMAGILAGLMFTVALSLKLDDFKALRHNSYRVIGGVVAQIVALPVLTMGLVILLSPPASIALGMIVVACCPGGNVSNVLTHYAQGNTAYSVSLTAISSVLSAIMTPISILFWSGLYPPTSILVHTLHVEPWPFLSQTVSLLALPLVLGMLFASRFPETAAKMRKVLTPVSLFTLAGLVVAGTFGNWNIVLAAGVVVIPIVVIHNASAFGLGAVTGRLLRLDSKRRRALTFEVGIQNAGLGLLILLNQFDGLGGAAALTAMWSVWHLIAGGLLALAFRLKDRSDNKTMTLREIT